MFKQIWRKTLFDQKISLLIWIISLMAMSLLVMFMFPAISEQGDAMDQMMAAFPTEMIELFYGGAVESVTSPIGWLNVELYGLLIPFALIIYGIGNGTYAIAGEEKNKTLELLVTSPISRIRLALEKYFALILGMLAILLSLTAFMSIFNGFFELDVKPITFFVGGVEVFTLALFYTSIGFALGTATGNRGLSMGITYAITIFSYLWNGFGGLIESIENTTNLSPFYHYSGLESQGSGVNLVEVIVVFLLSISFVMISIAIFNKRDIGT